MEPISDAVLDHPSGHMTFVGGTADLAEQRDSRIPAQASEKPAGRQLPLAMMAAGDRVWVVQIRGGHRLIRRLTDLGITQSCEITVVSRSGSGSVIVALQGCRIGIGAGMAHRVMVTTSQPEPAQTPQFLPETPEAPGDTKMPSAIATLGSLKVGQSGRILGYESGSRAYRGKLLSMGLTPGTQFTVSRQAPLGDPVEIEVRGFKLSLRKGEAEALRIETVGED